MANWTTINDSATVDSSDVISDAIDSKQLVVIKNVALQVIYIAIGILGVVDNLFVIVVFLGFTTISHRITNMLILNQSFIDLLASVLIFLYGLFPINGEKMTRDSTYDQFVCRIWLARVPLWTTLVASVGNIVVLTVERFIAIVHPVTYKMKMTHRKISSAMIGAWLYGFVFGVPLTIVSTDISSSGECSPLTVWPSKKIEVFVGILVLNVEYFLPILIMALCYGRMIYVLRNKVTPSLPYDQSDKTSMNVLKTLAIVTCCFALCWTWNQVFLFMYFLGRQSDFAGWFYHSTLIAVFISCCINPLIYTVKYSMFQDGVKRMLRAMTIRRSSRPRHRSGSVQQHLSVYIAMSTRSQPAQTPV